MVPSQAGIDANRRNSLKSTGPKTEEGKAKSRANALKHGLYASIVVAEDVAVVQQRAVEMFDTLKPQNELHCWLVDQAAIATIRIDRCVRMERRARDKDSLRAELTWDDDRRLDAERMGKRLSESPSEVVEELRRAPQGCDWLLALWAMLAHAADKNKTWTAAQARLAFNLLGTPAEFREGFHPGTSLDGRGVVLDPADDPAAVARREIALMEDHRETVVDLDEVERALTEADLVNDSDAELRRPRRYKSGLHKRLRWCLAELRIQSPYRVPDPSLPDSPVRPARGERSQWAGRHEAIEAGGAGRRLGAVGEGSARSEPDRDRGIEPPRRQVSGRERREGKRREKRVKPRDCSLLVFLSPNLASWRFHPSGFQGTIPPLWNPSRVSRKSSPPC